MFVAMLGIAADPALHVAHRGDARGLVDPHPLGNALEAGQVDAVVHRREGAGHYLPRRRHRQQCKVMRGDVLMRRDGAYKQRHVALPAACGTAGLGAPPPDVLRLRHQQGEERQQRLLVERQSLSAG